jgi:hypothetical protein
MLFLLCESLIAQRPFLWEYVEPGNMITGPWIGMKSREWCVGEQSIRTDTKDVKALQVLYLVVAASGGILDSCALSGAIVGNE